MKALILSLFVGSLAYGKCEVALYVYGSQVNNNLVQKLAKSFETALKAKNKDNRAYQITSPTHTWSSDYMYLVVPQATGLISVSVNDLLINNVVYRNNYNSASFRSENELARVFAEDFTSEVLPELSLCTKK